MTQLSQRKTRLRFQTAMAVRGDRLLLVEATPCFAVIREKGRRTEYSVPWDAVYWLGAKIAADRLREERKARKPRRRA